MTETTERDICIRAEALRKEFLRKGRGTNIFCAVDDVDLTLPYGALTVLKGRSGGGKTTLVNLLSGLLAPTKGRVLFFEDEETYDLYALADEALSRLRNRAFGYIPQGSGAIGSLTTLENILLPFTLYGDATDEARAFSLMERLRIDRLKDVYPAELSGGELKRMAIVRALVRAPKVVFADEPTGDLDDENTKEVFSLLRETASDGACVFVVTHEDAADDLADAVYRMDRGRLM